MAFLTVFENSSAVRLPLMTNCLSELPFHSRQIPFRPKHYASSFGSPELRNVVDMMLWYVKLGVFLFVARLLKLGCLRGDALFMALLVETGKVRRETPAFCSLGRLKHIVQSGRGTI